MANLESWVREAQKKGDKVIVVLRNEKTQEERLITIGAESLAIAEDSWNEKVDRVFQARR